jgi:hypothetical protein
MTAKQQMYDLVFGLLNLVTSGGIWALVGPLVVLTLLVRFMRWANATARGERDMGELNSEIDESVAGLGNRATYGRSYSQLRGMGFSDRELRQIRRGRKP